MGESRTESNETVLLLSQSVGLKCLPLPYIHFLTEKHQHQKGNKRKKSDLPLSLH